MQTSNTTTTTKRRKTIASEWHDSLNRLKLSGQNRLSHWLNATHWSSEWINQNRKQTMAHLTPNLHWSNKCAANFSGLIFVFFVLLLQLKPQQKKARIQRATKPHTHTYTQTIQGAHPQYSAWFKNRKKQQRIRRPIIAKQRSQSIKQKINKTNAIFKNYIKLTRQKNKHTHTFSDSIVNHQKPIVNLVTRKKYCILFETSKFIETTKLYTRLESARARIQYTKKNKTKQKTKFES